MIVDTKNGPVSLPATPPGGGYWLTADGMEPVPLTTDQLWRLAPRAMIPVEDAIKVSESMTLPPLPSASAAIPGGDSAASRTEGVPPVPPAPPAPPPAPVTGWPAFVMTAISAGVGAFLASTIALRGLGGSPPPTPVPEPVPIPAPNPSPNPPSPSISPLGSSLKTYLSATPAAWQLIGQQVSSGQITTQKDLLSATAQISKPVWDQISALVGSQGSPGQYTDSKGNITNPQALGQAIATAGREASK